MAWIFLSHGSVRVSFVTEAIEVYQLELAKYGLGEEADQRLLEQTESTMGFLHATSLEVRLVRSLVKPDDGTRAESCSQYLGQYATVPESMVHPTLWKDAQKFAAKAHKKK